MYITDPMIKQLPEEEFVYLFAFLRVKCDTEAFRTVEQRLIQIALFW